MTTWRHRPGRTLSCPFEYDNPEPEPVPCDCGEPDCSYEHDTDWSPTIQCHRKPAYRVILENGLWADCCNPFAHGAGPVVWWAPAVLHPVLEGSFSRALKYFYREEDLVKLADQENPLMKLVGGFTGKVTHELG